MLKYYPKISHLTLSSEITNSELEHISRLEGLHTPKLSQCPGITDDGMKHISKVAGLRTLELFDCTGITDVGIEDISRLAGLRTLILRYYFTWLITDAGMEHISKLAGLHTLELCDCRDRCRDETHIKTRRTAYANFKKRGTNAGMEHI